MRLDENLGAVGFDNLINQNTPEADAFSVSMRAGLGKVSRGTILSLSSRDGAFVILGTTEAAAIEAAAAEYADSADTALTAGKTYYTRTGTEGSYVYTAVTTPDVANIATYYEMTKAAVTAEDAETLAANCILAEAIDTGAEAGTAVTALAYRTGHFNRNKLTVKAEYTMTEVDEENLRKGGILLDDAFVL